MELSITGNTADEIRQKVFGFAMAFGIEAHIEGLKQTQFALGEGPTKTITEIATRQEEAAQIAETVTEVAELQVDATVIEPEAKAPKKRVGRPPKHLAKVEDAEPIAPSVTPVSATPATEVTEVTTPVSTPSTAVTREDAMAALKRVSAAGGKGIPAAREVLAKFGAVRMSEVKEADIPAFIQACDAMVG